MHFQWRKKTKLPRRRRTEPGHRQHAQKLVKIARVVQEICSRTNRQTERQTDTHKHTHRHAHYNTLVTKLVRRPVKNINP